MQLVKSAAVDAQAILAGFHLASNRANGWMGMDGVSMLTWSINGIPRGSKPLRSN